MEQLKGKNVRVRDGQWHYRIKIGGREFTGPTDLEGSDSNQSAAEEFACKVREQLKRRGPQVVKSGEVIKLATGAVPFSKAAAEFLAWAKNVEYRRKPATAARLKSSFGSAIEFFGEMAVNLIDAAAIEAYKDLRLNEHKVREISVRHDLHALSVFFRKYACKRGMAKKNPLVRDAAGNREVSIPSDADAIREHVITAAEEEAYFAAASKLHAIHQKSLKDSQPNMADLARLMLEQGARPEELVAAPASAFDPEAGTLLVASGKSRAARRTLYLTEASMEILKRRAALGSQWLFPSTRNPGHHMSPMGTTHDRICVEAGVGFVIYDFRHTFATRAIEAGAPVAVVSAIMGHSNLRSIHRYVHPSAQAQRDAMKRAEAEAARRKIKKVVG